MQDPPEKELLLTAVARFLTEDVRPLVSDPRINFRLLVAAHLAMTVANECRTGAQEEAAELARLRAFFPEAQNASLAELNVRLANDVRDGKVAADDPRLRDHVKKTLLAKLAINSPRFDTSPEIE
jgi:Domain of unknown function (DUF6285)